MRSEKKVAILQSNYIPWKGYFDLIAAVDEFIIYDDMQYTRRDWRNRNLIKTPEGLKWLTVPVRVKGRYHQTIRETMLDGAEWPRRHWETLALNYRKATHFDEVAEWLSPLYSDASHESLSGLNRQFIEGICGYLDINTCLVNSWDYELRGGKSARLADLCVQAQASEYVSGPSAKAYIEEDAFRGRGIKLTWFDYTGYPEYPQLWGRFEHGVSVLDLLFNCGCNASDYLKHVRA